MPICVPLYLHIFKSSFGSYLLVSRALGFLGFFEPTLPQVRSKIFPPSAVCKSLYFSSSEILGWECFGGASAPYLPENDRGPGKPPNGDEIDCVYFFFLFGLFGLVSSKIVASNLYIYSVSPSL